MMIPSPYSQSPHLLLQSSPGFFTNLVFLPKLSLPTPKTLSCYVANKKDASFPLELSHFIEKYGITLIEKDKGEIRTLPSQEKIDEILHNSTNDGKIQSISKHDFDEAKRVLDQNGLNPNVATFTTLIDAFCKRGKLQKAFEILDLLMSTNDCQPTVQTYNCLLKGLCYVGRVEEAFELMEEDIKKSAIIKPDIYTYTAMMDGFCKVGRSDEAMELLNEAIDTGLKPTVVTFNTLFHGYSKEGRPLEGISVLKRMKQANIMPDCISYITLIRGLLLWKKIRAALRVYKEMVECGYEGDERLMNCLLSGLCRKYMKDNVLLQDAYQVFDKMRKRGYVIDQSSYSLVVEALSIGKKVEDALVILQQMIRVEYVPRISIINRLIRAFCIEGKVDKAVLVLVIILYGTHKIPSRMTFDLIIQELNRQGKFLQACNIYGAALVRGTIPTKKPQE